MDSHHKLEKLVKINALDKKEGKVEIEKPVAVIKQLQFNEDKTEIIPQTFSNEFDRIMNNIALKEMIRLMPASSSSNTNK